MIELQEVLRACSLEIAGQTIVFDLIVLDITDFDVIIKIEWLIIFRTKINFYHMRVMFRTPEGGTLKFLRN